MRILFLDQYSELGGGQQALLDTVDAVRNRGWEPHVLVPGHGPLVDELQSRNVRTGGISCGPYRSGHKRGMDLVRFALDLHRQVRTIREAMADSDIGLIYVNGPRLLPAAALAARSKALLVFHMHSHLHGAALRLTRWAIGRTSATVIACSDSVLEPLRRYVDRRSLHVIPNGVPDAGYRERDLDANRCLRIGMAGRIGPEKGQMEFVNAAAILRNEFPMARFVICGAPLSQPSSNYFDDVRRRARELPMDFVGWQRDMSAMFRDLDLFVVPSHQEGMARVILEAFSAGVPVVAFPAGGIPEAAIDGVTGFLTRDFTAESLAACVREVIGEHPAKVREIVRNARRAWTQFYTPDVYRERVTNLLETLAPAFVEARAAETRLQHR
jgi:glycosyltransferase involved in cell wall biosynthesis